MKHTHSSPRIHRVRAHKRENSVVHSYVRGVHKEDASVHLAKPTLSKPSQTKEEVLAILNARAKTQGAPDNDEKGFNGWTNWDTWETMLLLENTAESDRWLDAWKKNFDKKIKGGRFDPTQAEKVVEKYLVPVARGSKSLKWAVGRDFTPDPEIDPKKVNKAEIIHNILANRD